MLECSKHAKNGQHEIFLLYIQQGPITHLLMKYKYHSLQSLIKSVFLKRKFRNELFTICTLFNLKKLKRFLNMI